MSSEHGYPFTFCFSDPVLMENRHACSGSAARTDHRPGERNTAQAMRCCQARWGFAPPTGAPTRATLPKLRLTSVSALDSSSHRLSPQPAHFRLGQPAQVAHGSSPEPWFDAPWHGVGHIAPVMWLRPLGFGPPQLAHAGYHCELMRRTRHKQFTTKAVITASPLIIVTFAIPRWRGIG
jgi:hypothetical protein